MTQISYIPALRFHALTRFYDALLARTLKEEALKRRLIAQAALKAGMRVLDLGCGTASLSLLIKQCLPDVELHALDADEGALGLARAKAKEAGLEIHFHQGYAQDVTHASPPVEAGTFDRILSSLVFHHLRREDKQRALSQAFELLKPGGELHIADWGRPRDPLQRLAFLSVQLLDGFETTQDSVKGIIPQLMKRAGFTAVEETRRDRTLYGTHSLYRGQRPES
jgi:ubiquinone/menaquinone biosynthesis C-methylase UbiE